VGNEFLVK